MNAPTIPALAAPGPALDVQRVTASCGVEAWLVEEHSLPLLALDFAFDGGANRDPADAAGSVNLVSGLLDEGADGIVLLSHVGRPDERLHRLGESELAVVFYGPSGYISPSWYGLPQAVPTWNFATVHAYGVPEILSTEENLAVLERLVNHFEDPLPHPFRMRGTLENAAYAERIVHGT
ncbi:FMN-binding negative transcriptional regulator, partial [Bosea sp. (in: a-proteobacteria)]|uniref:FMN-binding negative transcriptional regulator n=1 Tax=Bosea sp. (in: a-proteobacteria) TaxID=1871050 RepID=UPI001AC8DE8D